MDRVDQVYYVNLEYRQDRRLQFIDWIEESGYPESKVTRIDAVATPGRGHIGCLISHMNALVQFLQSPHNTCIIFEDDYEPLDVKTFWTSIQKVFDSGLHFDLVQLAYNELDSEPTAYEGIHRVKKSYTASGYLIRKEFAPHLLVNFKEALDNLIAYEEKHNMKADDFCLDVYWTKLMPVSHWYCVYPRLGKQRGSYSDLQGHYTDYGA